MRVMTTAGTAVAVLATAGIGLAADWPQWQGPDRRQREGRRWAGRRRAPTLGAPIGVRAQGANDVRTVYVSLCVAEAGSST